KGTLLLVSTTENYTVPGGGGSYQVTQHANYFTHYGVARADSYSVGANDYGSDGPVTLSGTQKTPMTQVGSAPAAGQFSVNTSTATFTFGAADAGKTVTITYVYSVPNSNSNGQPLQMLSLTLFTGARPQSPWSYLTSNHAGQDLGYNGIAYVAASSMDLGSSGSLPNYSFEILGLLPFGGGITDAEPGAIVNDLLTNPFYGVGWSSGLIGDYSNFSNYCKANGLFFSPVFDAQQDAASQIDDLIDLANGAAIWSEGVVKIKSYGDTSTVGNGATFTPNTTPVYDLNDSSFISKGKADPVQIVRKSRADTFNNVKIEFVNRANSYNVEIAEDKDDANISLYGLKADNPRQAHAITDATVAKKVANIKRLRSVYIDGGNAYKFTLGWQYILLEPMDLVTITDSNLGLNKHPVRITSIKENDIGELDFEAEDFPWGTANPTAYPYVGGGGFAPNQQADPGAVNTPIIFEANDRLSESGNYELWLGVSGASSNYGGCHVWLSTDNSTFVRIGTIHGSARMGTLTATLASAADPDTSDTLSVDLTESFGALSSGSAADCDNYRTLCYVDGEYISYQIAMLTSAYHYNLATRLRRGVFGTKISSHSSGSAFLRLDDAVFIYQPDPTLVGQTLYFKFTSFNKFELMEQSLANATSYSFSFNGSFANGDAYVSNNANVVPAWTGSAWNIQIYGPGGAGTSYTAYKSDKTSRSISAQTLTTDSTGTAFGNSTSYYVTYDPNTQTHAAYKYYSDAIAAVGHGAMFVGQTTTGTAGGTGGTGGGGGGDSGGGGRQFF
ncbi:MAG: phage tail protein, partial [Acidobacteria bacterium]|nr:phage tail protein [Acidobacteriota bacterium]